jgi:hypothetical protein
VTAGGGFFVPWNPGNGARLLVQAATRNASN